MKTHLKSFICFGYFLRKKKWMSYHTFMLFILKILKLFNKLFNISSYRPFVQPWLDQKMGNHFLFDSLTNLIFKTIVQIKTILFFGGALLFSTRFIICCEESKIG